MVWKTHSWQIIYFQYSCVVFSIVQNVSCLDNSSESKHKFKKKITSQVVYLHLRVILFKKKIYKAIET